MIMGYAVAYRVYQLMNETTESDDGYVTLINARKDHGKLIETSERTGIWAWKHFHKDTNTTDLVEVKGDVVFDEVDFDYNPEKIVLHDVKLFATPRQKIAFVGESGSGKTTLSKLLLHLYTPEKGDVLINGNNIEDIQLETLSESIAYIHQ